MQSKLTKKAPFYKYNELESKGATIVWGDPTKPSTYPRGNFDVVYDNNGKDLASCQPLIDHFKVRSSTCIALGVDKTAPGSGPGAAPMGGSSPGWRVP